MSVVINGSAGVTTNSGAVYNGIASSTAVTASTQTSIDFTNIPSWVKRITVMFKEVSTNGTSAWAVRVGTSSTAESTGYTGTAINLVNGASVSGNLYTNGFVFAVSSAAALASGSMTICLVDSSTNTWASNGMLARSDSAVIHTSAGSIALSGALAILSITTVGGTNTFDAGSINILYE